VDLIVHITFPFFVKSPVIGFETKLFRDLSENIPTMSNSVVPSIRDPYPSMGLFQLFVYLKNDVFETYATKSTESFF